MFLTLNDILGYEIQATDKPAGTVADIYIDDVLWRVRHVAVADAGGFSTQLASVNPDALGRVDRVRRHLHVNMTHDQLAGGPDVSANLPVSKRAGPTLEREAERTGVHSGDRHLRSISEVKGYTVVGSDGEVGQIEDFIFDDGNWKIHFVVVSTEEAEGRRNVLVGPGLINQVNFDAKSVHVDLDREGFADSPEYDPAHPIQNPEDVKLVGRVGI